MVAVEPDVLPLVEPAALVPPVVSVLPEVVPVVPAVPVPAVPAAGPAPMAPVPLVAGVEPG